MKKSPYQSYLVKNPYSYCFRLRVPVDIQPIIGKKELRYSLKTGYIGHAKRKACLLAGLCWNLFNRIRSLKLKNMALPENEFKELVDNCMGFIEWKVGQLWDEIETPRDALEWYGSLTAYINRTKMDLISGTPSKHLTEFYDSMPWAKERNQIDEGSQQWSEFNRTLALWYLETMRQEQEQIKTKYPELDLDNLYNHQPNPPVIIQPHKPQEGGTTLSELIQDYFDENLRAKNWKPRTIPEYKSIFRNIIRLMGDIPIDQITKEKCQEFKQILMGLPKDYFRAKKKYENVPIQQVVSEAKGPLLAVKTINKYIDNLSGLLNWGTDNTDLILNNAKGKRIKVKKGKAYQERDAFTDDDLNLIFHSSQYTDDKHDPAWKFWLPILALFTGARIEELCQLQTGDVELVDGIWIFNITEETTTGEKVTEEKGVKTEAANRMIPLHPFIVNELNFIKHVESVKAKGKERIFHELKRQSHRWGHYPSRWFGIYKRSLGISEKKTFHSFRHNFQDNLKQQLVPESVVDELVGHVLQGESYGRYGKPFLVKVRYEEAILKLNYNLDLSHLKKSKWVIKQ